MPVNRDSLLIVLNSIEQGFAKKFVTRISFYPFTMKKIVTVALLALAAMHACKSGKTTSTSTSKGTVNNDPVLARYGQFPVYSPEFEYVYKKNNANAQDAWTKQSLKDYLTLYLNFKMKVKEAEELGLDTAASFKKELEGYRKQLAQPYLTEKSVTEQLTREAYERMKLEVHAAHILINVSPDADPADTLKAWNKISDIRKRAVAGENFGKLASAYSEDPSAKKNGGDLGYFTSLQMVYPFEDAAYKTPAGSVSEIVRTRFGYHIIKVIESRPSQGQARVAHIMVRATSGIPEADSIAAKQKADEIYKRVKAGEDWDQLCTQFSDDVNSKTKGGELPWFSVGRMIPSFEEAAFKLENIGDVAAPIQTPYGWHVIKMLERKKLESYQEMEASLKSKVSKDSRSELNKTVLLQRLKKENNFQENSKNIEAAIQKADSSLINGAFAKTVSAAEDLELFSIKGEKYTTGKFFDYIKTSQRPKKGISPQQYMRQLYKEYANSSLLAYEEAHLEEKYIDYKMLVREYRDGILLFQLMDDKVWSKAVEDTAGLRSFFEKNNANYKWDTRAFATVYNVKDKATLDRLKQELKTDRFAVAEPKLEAIPFAGKSTTLPLELKKKADLAIPALVRDKSLILELTAVYTKAESEAIARQRQDSVKTYLTSRGIAKERIKTATPVKGDAGNVGFSFFSTSKKVLENKFNEKAPLTLEIKDGAFQKGENAIVDTVTWAPGNYTLEKNGRVYYVVLTKVEQARMKTFEEARGLAISDYQNYLEKQWIEELRKKYPPVSYEEELNKLVKP